MADIQLKRRNNSNGWDLLYPEPASHVHVQSEVAGLVSDLAAKLDIVDHNIIGITPTASTAGVWEATVPGITEYINGQTFAVKIPSYGSTNTLNINGLGAKLIRFYGTTNLTSQYDNGSLILLMYDAASDIFLVHNFYYSSEDYNLRWESAVVLGAATGGYQLLLEGTDGKMYPITNGGNSPSTLGTITNVKLKLGGKILYYNSGTDRAAGHTQVNYVYEGELSHEMEYWSNKLSAWATAGLPFYLKCVVQSDGTYKVNGAGTTGTDYVTQNLPTSDDGYIYIQIGFMYDTWDYWRLQVDHPIYQYKDGNIRLFVPIHNHDAAQITDFASAVETVSPSGSRPASDVYAWAKAVSKPSYNHDEIADGSTYKRVSQSEKNNWNSKATPASVEAQIGAYDSSIVSPGLASKVTKNANITAATRTKITYDAKGLVTGGTTLAEADIPTLAATKITQTSSYRFVTDTEKSTWNAKLSSVPNDHVTNARLANVATQTIKGRNTASTGDPEDLSIATVKTMLNYTLGSHTLLAQYNTTGAKTLSTMANYDLIYAILMMESDHGLVNYGTILPTSIGVVSGALYDPVNVASSFLLMYRPTSTSLSINENGMPISFQSGGYFDIKVYGINLV